MRIIITFIAGITLGTFSLLLGERRFQILAQGQCLPRALCVFVCLSVYVAGGTRSIDRRRLRRIALNDFGEKPHEDRMHMEPQLLSSQINWIEFPGFAGLYYNVLEVDKAHDSVELLMKFEPGVRCIPHRHIGPVKTLVLEGEHLIYKVDNPNELVDSRPAGSFTTHNGDESHIEAGGDQGAVILLSMTSIDGDIWETYDDDLKVDRISSTNDFERGLKKQAATERVK